MKKKLLNISFYLGSIPFVWLHYVTGHKDCHDDYHYLQVLALILLLFYSLIIFVVFFVIHNLIFYFDSNLAHIIPMELSFYIFVFLLLVLIILWIEGFIAALLGHTPKIPLYLHVLKRQRRIRCSLFLILLKDILVVIIIIFTIHSSTIAKSEIEEADVYMLYTDMGYIPRQVFTLGFYLESLATKEQWGENRVAIIPLTRETIQLALDNGRLVFIASHGANGCIQLQDGPLYRPTDLEDVPIGSTLQYVYLSGCETGLLHDDWQNALKPAYVKTFDRLSATIEHICWLLIEGPQIIHSLQ